MSGLLPEYVDHINVAQRVCALAKAMPDLDLSYCLNSFSHLVRWCFKRNFSAEWEIDALAHSDEIGGKFERMYTEKKKLERIFDVTYLFDCPVCDDIDGVVAELDSNMFDLQEVKPIRMACSSCGFVVSHSQPHLSEVLLEKQVVASKAKILKEYGLA